MWVPSGPAEGSPAPSRPSPAAGLPGGRPGRGGGHKEGSAWGQAGASPVPPSRAASAWWHEPGGPSEQHGDGDAGKGTLGQGWLRGTGTGGPWAGEDKDGGGKKRQTTNRAAPCPAPTLRAPVLEEGAPGGSRRPPRQPLPQVPACCIPAPGGLPRPERGGGGMRKLLGTSSGGSRGFLAAPHGVGSAAGTRSPTARGPTAGTEPGRVGEQNLPWGTKTSRGARSCCPEGGLGAAGGSLLPK